MAYNRIRNLFVAITSFVLMAAASTSQAKPVQLDIYQNFTDAHLAHFDYQAARSSTTHNHFNIGKFDTGDDTISLPATLTSLTEQQLATMRSLGKLLTDSGHTLIEETGALPENVLGSTLISSIAGLSTNPAERTQSSVPQPATILLLILGIANVAFSRRRKPKSNKETPLASA